MSMITHTESCACGATFARTATYSGDIDGVLQDWHELHRGHTAPSAPPPVGIVAVNSLGVNAEQLRKAADLHCPVRDCRFDKARGAPDCGRHGAQRDRSRRTIELTGQ